jgi:hypothetical protein
MIFTLFLAGGPGPKMIGHETERWMVLCGQAAVEQDPEKLLALTEEITRLLEEKEARLKGNPPPTHANDSRSGSEPSGI